MTDEPKPVPEMPAPDPKPVPEAAKPAEPTSVPPGTAEVPAASAPPAPGPDKADTLVRKPGTPEISAPPATSPDKADTLIRRPTDGGRDRTDSQLKKPATVVPSLSGKYEVAAAPAKPVPAGPRTALVIDDEPANRDFLIRLLEQAKMQVHGASSADEAMKLAEKFESFTLIAIDNKLPDMDGVELLATMRKRYPNTRLVMATMLDERSLMEKAFENGCDVFLVKPHGFMELFRRLQVLNLTGDDQLNHLIIDQYGPRPYRR